MKLKMWMLKKNGNDDVDFCGDWFSKKCKENLLRKRKKYKLKFMCEKYTEFILCLEKGKCLNAFSGI